MQTHQPNHGLEIFKARHNAPERVIGRLDVPEYDDDALLTKKQLATALKHQRADYPAMDQRWRGTARDPTSDRWPALALGHGEGVARPAGRPATVATL
jgi:hypothetical protein